MIGRVLRRLTLFMVTSVVALVVASPAWASTITVDSLADGTPANDGKCTLREAIMNANTNVDGGSGSTDCTAGTGDDLIDIGVTGTVNLTGALPSLKSNMDIEGPGADQFTVRRNTEDPYSIFTVGSGSVVSISGITISNGSATGSFPSNSGGGILNDGGTMTITGSTISGNSATLRGGGGNDVLDGGRGNDRLNGGAGNDGFLGKAGTDTLTGGTGSDFFSGGAGADVATDYTPNEDTGTTRSPEEKDRSTTNPARGRAPGSFVRTSRGTHEQRPTNVLVGGTERPLQWLPAFAGTSFAGTGPAGMTVMPWAIGLWLSRLCPSRT